MDKPIRVLCVFSSLDRGGAESMCMNLYRNIDRSKVQFDFVKHTHSKGALEEEITALGGAIYEAPRYKVYNHLQYCKWWRDHLNKHIEHRIVHGHFFTIAPIYFRIARRFNCKTISHSHCTWDSNNMTVARRIKKNILSYIELYSDYCLACSQVAGEWLYPHRKFKVINNAIDTQEFAFSEAKRIKIRNELGLTDEFVVGHVGNIAPVKNHTFLLDVFKKIHAEKPNSKLILVGNGSQVELKQKADRLGISDDVIFTGARSDVSDILQSFDVFAFPSLSEGLPVTVVEAQAAGLKCFISEAVTKEVDITGRCEFLPIVDPKLWADKILSADLTKVDTSEQIKAAGYDIHTTAKQLQRFYLKISERSK